MAMQGSMNLARLGAKVGRIKYANNMLLLDEDLFDLND